MGRVRASLSFRARRFARRSFYRDGSLETMWVRQVMNGAVKELLDDINPRDKRAVEVSGAFWGSEPWLDYQTVEYPQFDLVDPPTDYSCGSFFDAVIAD